MDTQIRLFRRQAAWEVAKAVAGLVAAAAVFMGGIVGVSSYIQRTQPPPSSLSQFPPGTVITIPPAPKP